MKARILGAALLSVAMVSTITAPALARTSSEITAIIDGLGIDSGDVVVQTGARLYAGPNCPGAGYDCVDPDGRTVVQYSSSGGSAKFECSSSTTDPTNCTIVQAAPPGPPVNLVAICTQGDKHREIETDPANFTCDITQDNQSGGNNTALVDQYVKQDTKIKGNRISSHVITQVATQETLIHQTAVGGGTNTAEVEQDIRQTAKSNYATGVTQDQEASIYSQIEQFSTNGNQFVDVDQEIYNRQHATGNVLGPILQRQNAADNGRDVHSVIRQESGNGYNTAVQDQDEKLTQKAKVSVPGGGDDDDDDDIDDDDYDDDDDDNMAESAQPITQRQGAPSGGLRGDIEGDQDIAPSGSNFSSYTATSHKKFKQSAKTKGTVDAIQDDLVECCDLPFGFSRTYHYCSIEGGSELDQKPQGTQIIKIRLLGQAEENCQAAYEAKTNGATDSAEQSGKRVVIGTNCSATECEPNRAPATSDVSAAGNEDTTIAWTPAASDPDGDTLVCAIEDAPANGTAAVAADCSGGTYTPDYNFNGSDSFTYRAEDPMGFRSTPGTVTITVGAVNDAPIAGDDTAEVDEDSAVSVDVLANDTDVDGNLNPSSLSILSGPAHGTASASDGEIHYTPAPNYNGPDSLVYQVCDLASACDSATLSLTVLPVNDAPVAKDDRDSTQEDTAVSIPVSDNDSDIDGNLAPSSVRVLTGPSNGSAAPTGDGSIVYTPALNWFGVDRFTYEICDTDGACDDAEVIVGVSPVNDTPVAADDFVVTDEEVPVTSAVFGNDSDVDGNLDPTSVVVIADPNYGTATAHGDGTVTYSPEVDFFGTDTYRYQICDTDGACDSALVTVTVNDVPEPPESGLVLETKNAASATWGNTSTVTPVDATANYRITYSNVGELAAGNVVVTHPVPSNGSVSCGSCTISGGTMTWNLGNKAGGSTAVLTFNVTYQAFDVTDETTRASGDSDNEDPFHSNTVTTKKQCFQAPTGEICDPI